MQEIKLIILFKAAVVKLSGSYNNPQCRVHNQRWCLVLDTTSSSLFLGPFRNVGCFSWMLCRCFAPIPPLCGEHLGGAKHKVQLGWSRMYPGTVGIPGVTVSSRNLYIPSSWRDEGALKCPCPSLSSLGAGPALPKAAVFCCF